MSDRTKTPAGDTHIHSGCGLDCQRGPYGGASSGYLYAEYLAAQDKQDAAFDLLHAAEAKVHEADVARRAAFDAWQAAGGTK